MKCLTICQPYAHLIVTPQAELPLYAVQKRVENRTWRTQYRGPLAIHAGKSLKFLGVADRVHYPEMAFGAIVGVCELVDCVTVKVFDTAHRPIFHDRDLELYPWLSSHFHADGPVCWVLANVRRLAKPVPYKGGVGLLEIDGVLIA